SAASRRTACAAGALRRGRLRPGGKGPRARCRRGRGDDPGGEGLHRAHSQKPPCARCRTRRKAKSLPSTTRALRHREYLVDGVGTGARGPDVDLIAFLDDGPIARAATAALGFDSLASSAGKLGFATSGRTAA